jgi:cytochrome b
VASEKQSIRIWDWPVRLSHWGFAVLVPAMWFTAEYSHWWWHTRLGVVLFALVIFRLIWGVIGTRTARFAQFVRGPVAIVDYLRGRGDKAHIGHSPLAALSVIALLAAMLFQTTTGLFGGDPYDGATGPLNSLVGVLTADWLTDWHKSFVDVIIALVLLHLAAIAFYAAVKRNNLVTPMVTGKRVVEDARGEGRGEGQSGGIGSAPAARVMVAVLIAGGLAAWVWLGAPPLG